MLKASLQDVQNVYSGPEGELWELLMGEQIHIGGYESSMDLARKAGIAEGTTGIDLCCATGGGMRFLVRTRGVARMTGVDATAAMLDKGRKRCLRDGMADQVHFVLADACATGLPPAQADFIWGEDAWCYVEDKRRLIAEAARLVRPGGCIAFTDWLIDRAKIGEAELERLLGFMKFPDMGSLDSYAALLAERGCKVETAGNTGRFTPYIDLYLELIQTQFRYDAFRLLGFDPCMVEAVIGEMGFIRMLAEAGKIIQGLFVARKGDLL